ncbi:MAG: Tat pathway signal sequence [Coriobacteriia bacterium]|nr:Tat pathway signal sequence [Coriobacteriia bacterium]
MAKSGLDSLMDALRASGANVDDKFKDQNKQASSENNTKKQEDTNNGGKGNLGDIPKAILQTPVVEKVKNLKTRGRIILAIIILLILAAAYWWFHPPINIHSETTWLIVVILVLLPVFLFFRSRKNKFDKKIKDKNDTKKMMKDENAKQAKKYKILACIPLGLAALGLLGMLVSASFFPGNAEKYASVLKTQDLDFKTDIQEANYNQIPIIDRETARVLGTKEMGSIPDYVSQFEISDLYSQINFQGKPVRVSCLMYADLFKWLTNREQGIPAYCIIDMATQNAKIVRISDVDGTEGQGIKYSESEPLARNIERYIQLKYPFYMFDEFSFEVDEQGHPWWICPVQERTIGLFGGKTISRAVLCDAVTGECQDMDVSEVPQWADRVYPSELLLEQYNWSGKYKNGWLNSWIGQSGVVKTTPGTTSSANGSSNISKSLGYNYIAKDDDVWVYTGVTSATSDSSIVGFILINQRTAESHFYSIAGATEVSAMESAEGQVQHLRYVSTFPILINVANQPTYFMALKDSAGLVKKFAMIDIQRYQNVAIGDTVAECQKAYQQLLTREGIEITGSNVSNGKQISGTIANMTQVVFDNNSHFLVTIAGDAHIYDFAIPGLIDIVKYKVGDQIKFHYTDGEKTQNVTSID